MCVLLCMYACMYVRMYTEFDCVHCVPELQLPFSTADLSFGLRSLP